MDAAVQGLCTKVKDRCKNDVTTELHIGYL